MIIMIRIMKIISLAVAAALCLIFGFQGISHSSGADTMPEKLRAYMKLHVDKVKVENPDEYQEMMDKAGGVVHDCMSCHEDEFRNSLEDDQD